MQKRKCILLTVAILFLSMTMTLSADNRVAILPFTGDSLTDSEFHYLTSKFESIMVKSALFEVVERREIDRVIEEQFRTTLLNSSGLFNVDSAIEIGELLHADVLVYGEVLDVLGEISLIIKGVNIETGRIMFSEDTVAAGRRDLLDMVPAMGRKFVSQFGVPEDSSTDDLFFPFEYEADGWKLVFTGTSFRSNRLYLNFTILNLDDDDRKFSLDDGNSYIYDEFGNSYRSGDCRIANSNWSHFQNRTILSGIETEASIYFKTGENTFTEITRLGLNAIATGNKIELKNIILD